MFVFLLVLYIDYAIQSNQAGVRRLVSCHVLSSVVCRPSSGLRSSSNRQAHGEPKYVICNADEGDPGAYMDRSLLEGNPHRVLEGMIIGAYAIGANEGYVYVRDEYPLASNTSASPSTRRVKKVFWAGIS